MSKTMKTYEKSRIKYATFSTLKGRESERGMKGKTPCKKVHEWYCWAKKCVLFVLYELSITIFAWWNLPTSCSWDELLRYTAKGWSVGMATQPLLVMADSSVLQLIIEAVMWGIPYMRRERKEQGAGQHEFPSVAPALLSVVPDSE